MISAVSGVGFATNGNFKKCSTKNERFATKNETGSESTGYLKKDYPSGLNSLQNIYYKKLPVNPIAFMGEQVYIVDGGNHATNMEHFAHAVCDDIDTTIYEVQVNPKNKNTKQLKSLEEELKKLNGTKKSFDGEYVAIPALASVPLLNIQDQYNIVMGENKKFTPENIKSNKKQLLNFLKELYEYPSYYSKYIGYMDSTGQGIEYTFGVIREINKLVDKGAKVYVPSGHPQDETIKYMAKQRGLNPELYHYIATGVDKDGSIEKIHDEIKRKNWYDFNLLSLSNANVVGVKGTKGAQDYMFAAYDSCVTDGARGVYNFTPIRKYGAGSVIGYSYTDRDTIEYPYDEFPANDEIEDIAKFVGKKYNLVGVLATESETKELKNAILNKKSTSNCADRLYLVSDIFSEDEIKRRKIDLMGEYVDKSLSLFFSKNSDGEIIFPKCDCEGSGKPSVLSMWGSCFSVFNAIARDIEIMKKNKEVWENSSIQYFPYSSHCEYYIRTPFDNQIRTHDLLRLKESGKYKEMEKLANKILENIKILTAKNPDIPDTVPCGIQLGEINKNFLKNLKTLDIDPNSTAAMSEIFKRDYTDDYLEICEYLIYALCKQGKYDNAKDVINDCIDIRANRAKQYSGEYYIEDIPKIIARRERAREINASLIDNYYAQKKKWENAPKAARIFMTKPVYPKLDDEGRIYDGKLRKYTEELNSLSDLYKQTGDICKKLGEEYPAKVCYAASDDFKNYNKRALDVIERRIDKVTYIGDLYNEIKPD